MQHLYRFSTLSSAALLALLAACGGGGDSATATSGGGHFNGIPPGADLPAIVAPGTIETNTATPQMPASGQLLALSAPAGSQPAFARYVGLWRSACQDAIGAGMSSSTLVTVESADPASGELRGKETIYHWSSASCDGFIGFTQSTFVASFVATLGSTQDPYTGEADVFHVAQTMLDQYGKPVASFERTVSIGAWQGPYPAPVLARLASEDGRTAGAWPAQGEIYRHLD